MAPYEEEIKLKEEEDTWGIRCEGDTMAPHLSSRIHDALYEEEDT